MKPVEEQWPPATQSCSVHEHRLIRTVTGPYGTSGLTMTPWGRVGAYDSQVPVQIQFSNPVFLHKLLQAKFDRSLLSAMFCIVLYTRLRC